MNCLFVALLTIAVLVLHTTAKLFRCPELFGLYPAEGSCQDFLQCSNGLPFKKTCPHPLHFNKKLGICDYPLNADCKSGASTTTPTPIPTLTSTLEPEFECPKPSGTFASPVSCQEYFECVDFAVRKITCEPGALFDTDREVCDYAENVNCPIPPPTSPPKFVCPKPNGIFASPVSCQEYFECVDNVAYKTTCEPGALFAVDRELCDYAENVTCPLNSPSVIAPTTSAPRLPPKNVSTSL